MKPGGRNDKTAQLTKYSFFMEFLNAGTRIDRGLRPRILVAPAQSPIVGCHRSVLTSPPASQVPRLYCTRHRTESGRRERIGQGGGRFHSFAFRTDGRMDGWWELRSDGWYAIYSVSLGTCTSRATKNSRMQTERFFDASVQVENDESSHSLRTVAIRRNHHIDVNDPLSARDRVLNVPLGNGSERSTVLYITAHAKLNRRRRYRRWISDCVMPSSMLDVKCESGDGNCLAVRE
jgi:hypothetical protein